MTGDKDLFDRISADADNITLPESLSRDNIVDKIKDTPQIAVVKGEKHSKAGFNKKKVIAAAVSFAAAFAIVVGIGAIGFNRPATSQPDNGALMQSNSRVDTAGYEKIEKLVADYYKKYGNDYDEDNNNLTWGLFDTPKDSAGMNTGSSASDQESAQNSAKYSRTNVQVDGVDEGDIVKTDGKNIYVLSRNRVYILDASDPKDIKTVSSFPTYYNEDKDKTGYSSDEIYFSDGKLITIVRVSRYDEASDDTYYTSCYAYDYNSDTVVSVYDISDPKAPTMTFSYAVSAGYVSSRLTDGRFILVGRYDIPYHSSCKTSDERIADVKSKSVPTEIINGQAEKRIDVNNINITSDDPISYQTILSFDINDCENTLYSGASLGGAEDIYCDGEYLYTANSDWPREPKNIYGVQSYSVTKIRAYKIADGAFTLEGECTVPGTIIGQFAMDRYSGYFRVAVTTSGYSDSENYVFVLDEKLNIVGKTSPFGMNENMQSVRFRGNTAYAVTFLNTDPLFVIDLTDPKSPEVKGKLKIPGFSSYLHPVSDSLVVGIGVDGDEDGTNNNYIIRLFDVSDPYAPKAVDSMVFKDAYLNTDSRAFVSFGDGRYAVIRYAASSYNTTSTSAAIVFTVEDSKLVQLGSYDCADGDFAYETRAVYINNVLYVVGDKNAVSYDLATGEKLGLCKYYN